MKPLESLRCPQCCGSLEEIADRLEELTREREEARALAREIYEANERMGIGFDTYERLIRGELSWLEESAASTPSSRT